MGDSVKATVEHKGEKDELEGESCICAVASDGNMKVVACGYDTVSDAANAVLTIVESFDQSNKLGGRFAAYVAALIPQLVEELKDRG